MERVCITPAEAAEMLGISRAALYRVMRGADFPLIRVGRSPRIPIAALHRWVDSQLGEHLASDEAKVR
jgi:excisionase family DNA binding protein